MTNGNTISEPKEVANAFNAFFINIGDTGVLNTNRNIDFNQYMPLKTNCTLIFHEITVNNARRIIDSLKPKTSTGVGSVSNKLLKFVKNAFSEPLTIIINQMLRVGTCIFQDLLKISTVVPVYEKDDNTNLSNYRLISLFLSMSKIFEKVILEQLFTYLEDNNLIHRQYGFKKHYSTDYAALHIVDYFYYKLDLKKIPINLYLLYRCISKRNKSHNHWVLELCLNIR